MSFRVTKRFDFSASHQLDSLPDGHPCRRLHGHNYTVEIELSAPVLDEHGMVKDYNELDLFAHFVHTTCDHHHLNDVVKFAPTAEALARWFFEQAVNLLEPVDYRVTAVRVSETSRTMAEYRP